MSYKEDAVREYLEMKLNPDYVSEQTKGLEEKLSKATDPIQIAKLKQQIRDEGSGKTLELQFIDNVQAWAKDNGIEAQVLREMNVPDEVLVKAGILDEVVAEPKAEKKPSKAVSQEDIERSLTARRKGSKLTIPQVTEDTGASNATVTKVFKAWIEQDKLKDLGPDPDHSGRGRSPRLYEKL